MADLLAVAVKDEDKVARHSRLKCHSAVLPKAVLEAVVMALLGAEVKPAEPTVVAAGDKVVAALRSLVVEESICTCLLLQALFAS